MIVADIIIALLLIFAAWRGYTKGIIMQIASLAALVLGVLAAYFFWNELYIHLAEWFDINHYVLKTISVIVIAVVVLLLILLLGKILSKVIQISLFGIFDRILGMVCGIVQLALALSFVIFALLYINPNITFLQDSYLAKSYILPHIKPIAPYIVDLFL